MSLPKKKKNDIIKIQSKAKDIEGKRRVIVMIKIKITSKELEVTEAMKDYVEKKAERLAKYADDIEMTVTLKTIREEQIAEMRVNMKNDDFKAITAHKDLYASIDKDIDILEGQIRKSKTKRERMNKEASIKEKEAGVLDDAKEIEDEIIKEIYYDIKPMDPEDAKMKLEEKTGNAFLPFINLATGKVNVIYRLKDGKNYGLVVPEA